uniref:THD domain-containing protein n=1 Tax=Branchiostoma floridae TaxID=7739 RepID=C3ZDW5_BRAFL|eukprot:XP_002592910.1 hypothetical protein BRAFLDRAFT_65495 [Branchiostoma floridae]
MTVAQVVVARKPERCSGQSDTSVGMADSHSSPCHCAHAAQKLAVFAASIAIFSLLWVACATVYVVYVQHEFDRQLAEVRLGCTPPDTPPVPTGPLPDVAASWDVERGNREVEGFVFEVMATDSEEHTDYQDAEEEDENEMVQSLVRRSAEGAEAPTEVSGKKKKQRRCKMGCAGTLQASQVHLAQREIQEKLEGVAEGAYKVHLAYPVPPAYLEKLAQLDQWDRRGQKERSDHQTSSSVIHVQGAVDSAISAGATGKMQYWQQAVNTGGYTLHDNGEIEVHEDGYYFIYSQVMYYDPSLMMGHKVMVGADEFLRCSESTVAPDNRYNTCYMGAVLYYDASAFMGHYVMVNGMSFLRCTATTVSPELKYNTGYAAAARRLQAGDRVYVKIAYPNRIIDMHADSTYFGMFKFSD